MSNDDDTSEDEGNRSSTTTVPSYTVHEDAGGLLYRVASGFPLKNFASALQYQAQPNDLFVATYPKCGTTWTQHMIYLLLNEGRPVAPNEKLDRIFPHLEEVGAEYVQQHATVKRGYRLIKTHFDYSMTPYHPSAKYICVLRNPKDCVVSFYHHTRGFPQHYNFANGSFDTYFQLFYEGKVDHGDYFHVTRSWLDHRNDPNVLLLTYESMRDDPRSALERIADFLGQPAFDDNNDNNALLLIQNILHHSSLDSMKKDPLRWCSARSHEHAPFIRKGSHGEWNELLTVEQAALLDQRMRETVSEQELAFLGDKY